MPVRRSSRRQPAKVTRKLVLLVLVRSERRERRIVHDRAVTLSGTMSRERWIHDH